MQARLSGGGGTRRPFACGDDPLPWWTYLRCSPGRATRVERNDPLPWDPLRLRTTGKGCPRYGCVPRVRGVPLRLHTTGKGCPVTVAYHG